MDQDLDLKINHKEENMGKFLYNLGVGMPF